MTKGLKEIYQRFFKGSMPTFFKRIFLFGVAVFSAPELLILVTSAIDQPEYLPSFINADWFKAVRFLCLGAGLASKFTVHWGKTPLKDVPDVSKPVDVIVNNATPEESNHPPI